MDSSDQAPSFGAGYESIAILNASEDLETTTSDSDSLKDAQSLSLTPLQMRFLEINPFEIMSSLPESILRRVKILKQLLEDQKHIESTFFDDVNALKIKYSKLYEAVQEKRRQVISDEPRVAEDNCVSKSPALEEDQVECDVAVNGTPSNAHGTDDIKHDIKGIPGFWKTVLKNVDIFNEMIRENDLPILKHLIDIRIKNLHEDEMNFMIEFHFEHNDFFTNSVLTKQYETKQLIFPSTSYKAPKIDRCRGCLILWNAGKDVTVRTDEDAKNSGIENYSFFNYFKPSADYAYFDRAKKADKKTLANDFKFAQFMRDRVIPRAAIFFARRKDLIEQDNEEFDFAENSDDYEDISDYFNSSSCTFTTSEKHSSA